MNMSKKHDYKTYPNMQNSINKMAKYIPRFLMGLSHLKENCRKNHNKILAKSCRLGKKQKNLLSLPGLKQVREFLEDDE
jgi:hypothetical protein